MTNKELKKLGRAELLELLIQKMERIEELEGQVNELQSKLADRELKVSNAGSLAEAALQLSGIFEAAQRAADLYLENLKRDPDTQEEAAGEDN